VYVDVNNKLYSIYIGNGVSCAHGALIHGPCQVDDHVFIGFKSIVYNARVREGCFISTGAVITGGITLHAGRFVPPGAHINTRKSRCFVSGTKNGRGVCDRGTKG
jgi:carbonic anhydrase